MGVVEMLGIASSISLLAGWRMYLCVFATGLAMRYNIGGIQVPANFESLQVLASPWVIGAAGFGAVAEFFADKIAWLDSLWDSVHTAVRPIGGAVLAAALVDPSDPTMQVVSMLLGGGAALMAHGAKAGTRAVVNASPEPFSNVAVSTGEDVVTGGLIYTALANPTMAAVIAIVAGAVSIFALIKVRQLLKKIFGDGEKAPAKT